MVSYKPLEPSNGVLTSKALVIPHSFISDSSVLKTWGNPLSLPNLFLARENRIPSSTAQQEQFPLSSPEPELLKVLDLSVRIQFMKLPAHDYLMGSGQHKASNHIYSSSLYDYLK